MKCAIIILFIVLILEELAGTADTSNKIFHSSTLYMYFITKHIQTFLVTERLLGFLPNKQLSVTIFLSSLEPCCCQVVLDQKVKLQDHL